MGSIPAPAIMQVAVEYIKWIQEERWKVNRAKLEDIEFFENGMKIDIPKEAIDKFELTGLNNIDFIWSGFYKEIGNGDTELQV